MQLVNVNPQQATICTTPCMHHSRHAFRHACAYGCDDDGDDDDDDGDDDDGDDDEVKLKHCTTCRTLMMPNMADALNANLPCIGH